MTSRTRLLILAAASVLLTACASGPKPKEAAPSQLSPFSALTPGEPVPADWSPWNMSRLRGLSQYQLVEDNGATVLKGSARDSASGLLHDVDLDVRQKPILSWRWKVMDLATSDDSPDDSPVRIMVNFD